MIYLFVQNLATGDFLQIPNAPKSALAGRSRPMLAKYTTVPRARDNVKRRGLNPDDYCYVDADNFNFDKFWDHWETNR